MVGGAAGEDLCLARETAKGARLHHAVAVALKGGAVIAGWSWIRPHREFALVFSEDTAGVQVMDHT